MTVYLDVLLITNAVVCLVLIEASATVSHRVLKPWRSFCGAAVGALSSLLIAADSDNRYCAAAILILKLSAIVLTVMIAFGFGDRLWRRVLIYLTAKLVFTGVCFLLWQFTGSRVIIVQSFTVYFNIPVMWLILAAGGVYVMLEAAERIRALHTRWEGYRVIYQRGSLIVSMPAVCDSGNKLCDSFTGQPVVVLCSDKLYHRFGLDSPDPERLMGFRLTPFNSVGGQGLIHITNAGSIRLIEPCGRERELRCCVGITRSEGRRQRALFSPVLLGG
ncbi:MAG: sigma-E processing peptidase SpoIIGA [Ruminococcus sp.]|nr:sigma-E processing peptidase SpoIIGA [Ruminococcus sp.]